MLVFIGLIVWAAYLRFVRGYVWADWTGFRGKTLWDFQVVFIGVAGAILLTILNIHNTEKRARSEREIAADRQHEVTLQGYLDKMAELLLKENLREEKDNKDSIVIGVAQILTITTLRKLDYERRNIIFQFLRDAKLAEFILKGVTLQNANLQYASLFHFNLSEALLSGANLRGAFLEKADLSRAYLNGADLSEAYLNGANLFQAILDGADLQRAYLGGTNLRESHLRMTNMRGAILSLADLDNANLTGADLRGARVSSERLAKAKFSEDIILPNGTKKT
jgi:uncharacterized protein YjbI with pentapeptide repeats